MRAARENLWMTTKEIMQDGELIEALAGNFLRAAQTKTRLWRNEPPSGFTTGSG